MISLISRPVIAQTPYPLDNDSTETMTDENQRLLEDLVELIILARGFKDRWSNHTKRHILDIARNLVLKSGVDHPPFR